jgi:hypothetical protein
MRHVSIPPGMAQSYALVLTQVLPLVKDRFLAGQLRNLRKELEEFSLPAETKPVPSTFKEVVERLTLVDRSDVTGEVWLLLRPKGSLLGRDLVHGGGTIRVTGEFARALSTYFKEREAAIADTVGDAP